MATVASVMIPAEAIKRMVRAIKVSNRLMPDCDVRNWRRAELVFVIFMGLYRFSALCPIRGACIGSPLLYHSRGRNGYAIDCRGIGEIEGILPGGCAGVVHRDTAGVKDDAGAVGHISGGVGGRLRVGLARVGLPEGGLGIGRRTAQGAVTKTVAGGKSCRPALGHPGISCGAIAGDTLAPDLD